MSKHGHFDVISVQDWLAGSVFEEACRIVSTARNKEWVGLSLTNPVTHLASQMCVDWNKIALHQSIGEDAVFKSLIFKGETT